MHFQSFDFHEKIIPTISIPKFMVLYQLYQKLKKFDLLQKNYGILFYKKLWYCSENYGAIHQEKKVVDPVEKVLMTFLFFLFVNIFHVVIKCSSNPLFPITSGKLSLGAPYWALPQTRFGTQTVPRHFANKGRSFKII